MNDDTIGFKYLTEAPKQTDWQTVKPSKPAIIKSLLSSVKKIVKSGFKRVPKKVVKYRLEVCRNCQNWKPDGNFGLGQCTVCGCSFIKSLYSVMACPKNYWEAYE